MKRKIIFPFLLLIVISGCFNLPDNVISPEWDTYLNIPITKRQYNLSDRVKPDKYISIDSTNNYKLSYSNISNRFGITDFIKDRLNENKEGIEIPIANGEGNVSIIFSSGISLDSAVLTQGTIQIKIHNTSANPVDVEIKLPALIQPDGNPLIIITTLPANQITDISKDLKDYKYSGANQTEKNKLLIQGKITKGDVGGKLLVDVFITNTNFSYVRGNLPSVVLKEVKNSVGLPITGDLEKFRDHVEIYDPVFTLQGNYFSPLQPNELIDVLVDTLKVIGWRKNGQNKKLLDKNNNENLGNILFQNGSLTKVFDNSNTNLSDFLSFIPDSIQVVATAIMNPNSKYGAATNLDTIQVKFTLELQSLIKITDLNFSDTLKIDIKDGDRSQISNGRATDSLYFEITNMIPVETVIDVAYGFDSLSKYISKNPIHLIIDGAMVNESGISFKEVVSNRSIYLDSLDIDNISKSKFMFMNVSASTTNKNQAKIRPSDWIKIISWCRLKYHEKSK